MYHSKFSPFKGLAKGIVNFYTINIQITIPCFLFVFFFYIIYPELFTEHHIEFEC